MTTERKGSTVTKAINGPQFYSITEAADALGVSQWTIRRRIADGTIKARRFGRLIRIDRNDLTEVGEPVTAK